MKRRKFSLSHYRLFSCHFGTLIPVTWFEALPGDTIQHSVSALVRAAPMVTPAMHVMEVRFHTFFVPNRILWTTGGDGNQGWESFITGGATGTDNQAHPFISSNAMAGAVGNNAGVSTLADYMGVPTSGLTASIACNALPFRAYQAIFNEFYRDQDLQVVSAISTGPGNDSTTGTSLQNCCWEKDYLTTCRTTNQKGPNIGLFPAGAGADPVLVTAGTATTHASYPGAPALGANSQSTPPTQSFDATTDAAVAGTFWKVDLGNAVNRYAGMDINSIRQQFAIMRYQEARAFYGSRYTEYLAYLGVRASDARLQRPEYLGGGRSTIQISEVLQTAPTTSGTAGGAGGVGQYGGHGISGMRANRYRKFIPEHGIIMTLMSIRPRSMYSQRLRRDLMRGSNTYVGLAGSKIDYWQRELEHIGQQQVCGLEADASSSASTVFGFQDRYDEYRRMESSVHGQFRSTLDTWHLSREFGSTPTLNATFVSCVPASRIFADTTNDNFYVMTNHHIVARRLVSRGSGVGRVF